MKEGDKKAEIRFAYLPVKIGNKKIWLMKYLQCYECINMIQRVVITVSPTSSEFDTKKIYDLEWIETEKKEL